MTNNYSQGAEGPGASQSEPDRSRGDEVVNRILSRDSRATALGANSTSSHTEYDGDQFDLEERAALK